MGGSARCARHARVFAVALAVWFALARVGVALNSAPVFEQIEPRCLEAARRYEEATTTFAKQGQVSCEDVARVATALETAWESPCGEVDAKARFLAAQLWSSLGQWERAGNAIRDFPESSLSVKIESALKLERARDRSLDRRGWKEAYSLADRVARLSACSSESKTFGIRALAALRLGMRGRAFVDAKHALKLGWSLEDAYGIMAEALTGLADNRGQLADAGVLARECLRHAPESKSCMRRLKGIKSILGVWDAVLTSEASEDWDAALIALTQARNSTILSESLKFEASIASCRIHGKRERAKWLEHDEKFTSAHLSVQIAECTDVLSELFASRGDDDENVVEMYRARAWMRLLSGNVDGAAADLAGIERGTTVDVEELREAIEKARAASEPKDLYSILGLTREDALAEDWLRVLKKAYRKLALVLHPDKNPTGGKEEAEEKFNELVKAYKILSSETLRREYDRTGRVRLDIDNPNDWSDDQEGEHNEDDFDTTDYVFRYDKRDVGADGRARGQWVNKQTGDRKFGERDVRDASERRENICAVRKGFCIEGRGGEAPVDNGAGVETLKVKFLSDVRLPGDEVAARIVRNHFGFQKVEFMFVFDIELPGDEARDASTTETAKARLRRLVRTLHSSLVGRESRAAMTSIIEEDIVNSLSSSKQSSRGNLLEYVASALGGSAQRIASAHSTTSLLDGFAAEATLSMRRLGAFGTASDSQMNAYVSAARNVVANPLVTSSLFTPQDTKDDDAIQVRRLTVIWRDDFNSRPFARGDILAYEVKIIDSDDSDDVRAVSAALDFETENGLRLSRSSDVTDQFGFSAASTSVNFGEIAHEHSTNGWITRRVPIPDAFIGHAPKSWHIAASRAGVGRARVRLRDVKVYNPSENRPVDDVVVVFPSKSSH